MAAGAAALWTRARVGWATHGSAAAPLGDRRRHPAGGVAGRVALVRPAHRLAHAYAGLDPDDARQIGLTLTQAQIPFDVADNGTTLRVPAAQLDKARLATAAKGGAKSGRMGFELFDKPNWVGSEFDEQVNYQRALEGELEHTVARSPMSSRRACTWCWHTIRCFAIRTGPPKLRWC